jgi:putative phosphoribosyl transferase
VTRGWIDRADAGERLGRRLAEQQLPAPVVVGLARGGVELAAPIAAQLGAPLDVLVVRKVGHPGQPELGLGALAEGGPVLWDEIGLAMAGLAPADLAEEVAAERAECRRRVSAYRSGRRAVLVTGRTVVVVDDGVATGVTARAAVRSLRDAGAARVVLAAPVVAAPTMASLRTEADDVVTLVVAQRLGAVSRWYADFRQTTDEQVVRLLHQQSG